MSKHKNRIAEHLAQSGFKEDVERFKLQKLKRFLTAMADLREHGSEGEVVYHSNGDYEISGRLQEMVEACSDLSGLSTDHVLNEIILGALDRLERNSEEGGFSE